MSDYLAQIQELLKQSNRLNDNLTKVNLIEAAIKIADSHQDIKQGFELRKRLMNTYCNCGYPEKLLVAFSWCLAQCDANPEQFTESQMLWTYKWIMGVLDCFPQVSRQQIEASFQDMERRYLRAGKSLRAVYNGRLHTAQSMGDLHLIPQYYQQWQNATKDSSEDCAGCELNQEISIILSQGKDEQALNKAKPIISGKLRCDILPHVTLSKLLIPLVKLQRLETAKKYYLQSHHKLTENNYFVYQISEQILFLALTNNVVKAMVAIEKNINIAATTTDIFDRFYFYRACYFLMSCLLDNNTTQIDLLLPHDFSIYNSQGKYRVKELADWFKSQAETIAEQFNRRNGNNFYTEKLTQLAQLKQYRVDYPIVKKQKKNKSINLNSSTILDAEN